MFFEHPALGVGAVEHGDIAPTDLARLVQARHLVGHPLALVGFVVGVVAPDLGTAGLVAPQLLGLAPEVVGDDRVGGIEDGLGRPVVLFEQDHRGVGEGVLELQDVANVGAPEAVNAVVDDHPVGHVVVDRADLEVVDGTVVVLGFDPIDGYFDEIAGGVRYQDTHPHPQVGQGHDVIDAARESHPTPDLHPSGRRNLMRQPQSFGVAVPNDLDALAGRFSLPDRKTSPFEAFR